MDTSGIARTEARDPATGPSVALETIEALDAATRAITEVLDLDAVLQLIVDRVRLLVDAHYAALGIVGRDGRIERFLTSGITAEQRALLGPPPEGHGLLGLIIREGRSIRIPDITRHPDAYGFPPHHPPMRSLLGVPIALGGRPIGDLYLTDKQGAEEFSATDEQVVSLFARHAAIAIENARLHERLASLRVVAERERIGRDLHDGVIQGLYAVGLSLEDVDLDLMARSPDEAAARVDRAIDGIHRSISDIREFIMGLRPGLSEVDLEAGIAGLTDQLRLTSALEVEVPDEGSIAAADRIDPAVRGEVLHIIREALSNVARHARARHVRVALESDRDGVRIVIADDGAGFDPTGIASARHHGLVNMRERAVAAGGRLEIDTRPGSGTRLVIHLPATSEAPTP